MDTEITKTGINQMKGRFVKKTPTPFVDNLTELSRGFIGYAATGDIFKYLQIDRCD